MLPIRPTLITRPEIAKDTITPQLNENPFRQETMQNTWLQPREVFKIIKKLPETPIIQTLAVKEMVTGSGEGLKDSGQSVIPKNSPDLCISEGICPNSVHIYDGDILDYIASKNWNYGEAVAVMMCENFNADAYVISKSGDIGLFQINLKAHWSEIPGKTREEKITWLQNPLNNVDFAFSLYQVKKWGDWYMSYPCHNLK